MKCLLVTEENKMHRLTRIPKRTITTVFVIALAAVAAYAGINYKSGPSFSIAAGSFNLTSTGELSGLGGSAHVTVDVVGTADGSCTNKGGNVVPVQAASVTASGSETIHPDSSGRSTFSISAGPVAANPCPNGNWTFDITKVSYNSAKVSITAGGSQSLTNTFTFTGSTPTYPNSGACTRASGDPAETCTGNF